MLKMQHIINYVSQKCNFINNVIIKVPLHTLITSENYIRM